MFLGIYIFILLCFSHNSSPQSTNSTLNETTLKTTTLASTIFVTSSFPNAPLISTTIPYVLQKPQKVTSNVGLGIGIGVGGLFVLLAIVLVILYCVLKPLVEFLFIELLLKNQLIISSGDEEDQDNIGKMLNRKNLFPNIHRKF